MCRTYGAYTFFVVIFQLPIYHAYGIFSVFNAVGMTYR